MLIVKFYIIENEKMLLFIQIHYNLKVFIYLKMKKMLLFINNFFNIKKKKEETH